MAIEWSKTERGFLRGEFRDRNGDACSIQESSADGGLIWLGCDHETIHSVTGEPCGARMHLTRDAARELVGHLAFFSRTGRLKRVDPRRRDERKRKRRKG